MQSLEEPVATLPATEAERPPARSNRAKWVLLFVLLIAVAVGVGLYLHYEDQVSSDDAEVDGHITAIAPKIGGNVVEVAVLDNQPVKEGQVLVRIDPRDFQARVDLAQAALERAESQLRSAQVGVPLTNQTTESTTVASSAGVSDAQAELERARIGVEQAAGADLAVAEANVRTREADNDKAQADLARMKPLVDKAEISQQQYDAYVAAAKVTASQLRADQQKLESARQNAAAKRAALEAAGSRLEQAKAQLTFSQANRKQVAIRQADAATAAAAVSEARAELEAARLQLSYTTLAAPVDGVVTRKSVEVGQVVQPGQALMAVIPLNTTWVTANFKETQLSHVQPGQRAEIQVDMYGKSVIGHVDSIAGATGARMSLLPPENATGNFVKVVQRIPVKILVDQTNGLILRPGMNVDVTIYTR
ncbi:MAG: HlyD family secretion protein [Bryobacteraceae bacterium]|jgi:membrane fusion protein (multidrug efflux system)